MTTETIVDVPPCRPQWVSALLSGALSFVLTFYCLELIKISGQISPLWFSTALMTVAVFRHPPRSLPLRLGACMLGIICANALVIGPDVSNLIFPLFNLAQALAGGLLLRLLLDPNAPLNSLYSWVKMMLAVCVFSPVLGGLLASCLLSASGKPAAHFFATWTIAEMIGMLALGPVYLLWPRDRLLLHLRKKVVLETLATLVVTLALCWLTLLYLPWPFTFVIVILFYSAVRLPRLDAFLIFLVTIAMMSLMLALQLIPADSTSTRQLAAMPWFPFLLVLLPSHMMTLVMHSFRAERKHIAESETRFRHAMEYSAIGMALVSPAGKWLQVNKALCRLLGYQAHELLPLTFQQLTHPQDLDADLQQVRALLAGEIETYSMEKRYFRKDHEVVWALLAVSLVRDGDRQPLYFIAQIEDITELKQTERVNQRLMERITLANDAAGIGVWEWDLSGKKMSWDRRMFQLYRLPASAQASYQKWLRMLHPADRARVLRQFAHAIKNLTAVDVEFRISSDIGIRYIRSQGNIVKDKHGAAQRILGINQDVTALRQLTDALYEEKERMHITLDAIGEAVISTDEEMQVIFMNPVAERMSGWLQSQAVGKPLSEILRITRGSQGPEMDNLLSCDLPATSAPEPTERDLVLHNRAGEQFAIHYSLSPLKTLSGENIGSVIVIHDVSESREIMKRLSYSASHDMLTRLPNRVSFEERLKALLLRNGEMPQQHALMFIDLDRFKAVNDSAGHAAGDALLRALSDLMLQQLRAGDLLARLGGDEFGVLLQHCSLAEATQVAQRMVNAVNAFTFPWQGQLHQVGASVGLTEIVDDNASAGELMAQADLACYSAKHNGRGQISVYDRHLPGASALRFRPRR